MRSLYEVSGRFDHPADASKLLYEPLGRPLQYQETRRYTVEHEGDTAALVVFLRNVLADACSHELHLGEAPALRGFSFYLDYGMKPGALDLEKETIMNYYRGLPQPAFSLQGLKIQRRVYLFGAAESESLSALREKFVRDMVNPAIHHWSASA